MYKRVKYVKTSDDKVFQSVKVFDHATNGARYKVILDTNTNQWSVVDDTCGLIAASGHIVNVHLMKKQAKEALAKLGIQFESETGTRNTKFKKLSVAS